MSDDEFAQAVRETMRHVFAVHNDLGRFFDERIYQAEIAFRMTDARREVPIDVTFDDFRKMYFIDLLVDGGAIFELKAVQNLNERHRSQLMNYLFLTDMRHGKLVNVRPERVSHEFVNNVLTREDRVPFEAVDKDWRERGGCRLREPVTAALREWGASLDLGLYEDAATHFCGRGANPFAEIEIRVRDRPLGVQKVRLADPVTALKITCLDADRLPDFECHARRFLDHTSLQAVQWINITRAVVQFKTLEKTGK